MRKTLITITINDDDLDKILPPGTPKAGVRRAKIAATVCTNIVQTMIDGVGKKEKTNPKDADASKEEPAAKVEEAPKKETTKKTTKKTATKK